MHQAVHIPFDNSYIQVAETLFSRQLPTPVKQPGKIRVNDTLAAFLGIDPQELHSAEGIEVLAGNRIPEGAEPIATVYAGHQFGSWNPQLGDGRAILLGEIIAGNQQRYDLQLKGAGVTPYSRMGDGRSPLGPVLREYIVSEAMAAMGVPTTRALAAVTTGEPVLRDEMLPGAILTRIASSHIRVGTFQFFAARNDLESVKKLADHVIARHYPEVSAAHNPYLALLQQVVRRQAQLVAQWQSLGFIHGVMNTDNMLVCGETVDYGPCAFMEYYEPAMVFSSIDQGGRYAYANQPNIAYWNLAWLAQALLHLIDTDEPRAIKSVQEVLEQFQDEYHEAYLQRMCRKLGLTRLGDNSQSLLLEFLDLLHRHEVDFTLGFRVLSDLLLHDAPESTVSVIDFSLPEAFTPWLSEWRHLLGIQQLPRAEVASIRQRMNLTNPVFIPRNHRIEEAISAANQGDLSLFHRLVDVLATPFDFDPDNAPYAEPAGPEQRVTRTFCGT